MTTFAQISDCHLFAKDTGKHFDASVYPQLISVLQQIKCQPEIEFIIFTGDLSQDHSEESYQLFNQAFVDTGITCPVYYLAGNHDEPKLFSRYLTHSVFEPNKTIELDHWQLQLLDSKSETPAGVLSDTQLERIASSNKAKFQFLLMHHHPIDVGYFIDRHGLKNQEQLWLVLAEQPHVKAISCGHVHRAMSLSIPDGHCHPLKLFSCPATSITFGMHDSELVAQYDQIGYRRFTLYSDGNLTSSTHYIEAITS